jgi:alcohol dehydrogenase class IV
MDDEYKGEDRKGRVTYDKYKKAKKALKGDDSRNAMQQFMDSLKKMSKKAKSPNEVRKAALQRAAAERSAKKSIIPKSPTN